MTALRKAGFEEEECAVFADKILGLLDDSRELFGEGKAFEYTIRKRFGRLELQIRIAGERFNPFEDRKLGCDGMIRLSAATNALIVITPSEGMQSIMM